MKHILRFEQIFEDKEGKIDELLQKARVSVFDKFKIDPKDKVYFIAGSARAHMLKNVKKLFGLFKEDIGDLDIIIPDKKLWIKAGLGKEYEKGVWRPFNNSEIEVFTYWDPSKAGGQYANVKVKSTEKLMEDAEFVGGYWFMSKIDVFDYKSKMGRPKEKEFLQAWKDFKSGKDTPELREFKKRLDFMTKEDLEILQEELKSQTYLSASRKLKKLGHVARSTKMHDWAREVENRESMDKWRKNIQDYSQWGKATLIIKNDEGIFLRGDFYLALIFDETANMENIELSKEENDSYFNVSLYFSLAIIPTDEETLNKFKENYPESDFSNGFFFAKAIYINYKIEDSKAKFINISMDSGEGYGLEIEIHGRKSAMTLKKHIIACLDENQDYTPDSSYSNMAQYIFAKICQESDMDNYGLTMDKMLKDVKGYSPNYFYKD
jgi:hypothetical protein